MPVKYTEVNGTSYHEDTPKAVIDVLENARLSHKRVRLFLGDRETGRDWLDENDVTGTIGRSTGLTKVPLLIANNRSLGGPAILDQCIIRIMIDGVEKYRQSNYQEPVFEIKSPSDAGYVCAVYANGKIHAQFKKPGQAERWISFMKGQRLSK